MAISLFRNPFFSVSLPLYSILLFSSNVLAQDCLHCHTAIGSQFSSNSHHIQGKEISSRHCYSCHWEAGPDGSINENYHQKDNARVDLVVWDKNARPSEYIMDTTAVIFSASAIGTAAERASIAKVTTHCLGCHSDRNNRSEPFGDAKTPNLHAWDGQSIDSRYSNRAVTAWGKYSTTTTNKKNRIIKALSAHGNAAANQGGWSPANGYDGDIPLTRGGKQAKNIECFDCHNSHGSSIQGVTSSYRSFEGTFSGGILKETAPGKSGYKISYRPTMNSDTNSINPYNPGAGLCFDCHETAAGNSTPWGYNQTFGATEPVIGYKDTMRFGPGSKGSTARHSGRQSRATITSSHLKSGRFLNHSAHGEIRGLCTPCHDPHGVSRTLGEKMSYAVPLLKESWMTSPYREDGPPTSANKKEGEAKTAEGSDRGIAWEKGDFSFTNREANANFGVSGGGAPREPMSRTGMKYNVDRNTFGANSRIAENETLFAGLCLKCHPQTSLTGESKSGRIHRTVKGWGNNKEHSFPCSKCHQSHNSGLPRLMQTNCFEIGPSGLRDNSGLAWMPEQAPDKKKDKDDTHKKSAGKGKSTGKTEIVGCHVRQFGGNPAKKEGAQWNEKTKW